MSAFELFWDRELIRPECDFCVEFFPGLGMADNSDLARLEDVDHRVDDFPRALNAQTMDTFHAADSEHNILITSCADRKGMMEAWAGVWKGDRTALPVLTSGGEF